MNKKLAQLRVIPTQPHASTHHDSLQPVPSLEMGLSQKTQATSRQGRHRTRGSLALQVSLARARARVCVCVCMCVCVCVCTCADVLARPAKVRSTGNTSSSCRCHLRPLLRQLLPACCHHNSNSTRPVIRRRCSYVCRYVYIQYAVYGARGYPGRAQHLGVGKSM